MRLALDGPEMPPTVSLGTINIESYKTALWTVKSYGNYGDYYRLKIVATSSSSGNPTLTGRTLVQDYPPEVTISLPSEGANINSGDTLAIRWTTFDEDLHNIRSYLYYAPAASCPNGATLITYRGYEQGGTFTYNWTVPSVTTGNYCVYVKARDLTTGDYMITTSDTREITITDTPLVPPTVSVTSLAGDTSAPYYDYINDSQTALVLGISSADATQCKHYASNFNPATQGWSCTMNGNSQATCNSGSLPEQSYTRYYSCYNGAWSDTQSINFTVSFPVPVVSIKNLAGDKTAPYNDFLNDGETNLVLTINSNDATLCKYSTKQNFNPATQGTACTQNTSSKATCAIGALAEGNYRRYYSCYNGNTSKKWSSNQRIDFLVDFLSGLVVKIESPENGEEFNIGSLISFDGNIESNFFDYSVQWDSNKDLTWAHDEEDFDSTELSIGDHNITLRGNFHISDEENYVLTDSILLRILPVASDVLGISSFEIQEQLRADESLPISVIITNSSNKEKEANLVLTIIHAETGIEAFSDTTQNPTIPARGSEEIVYIIDLSSALVTLQQGNYKVKLDVAEYPPEQNTANNHKTKIISVLAESAVIDASELQIYIVPAIVIVILILLNKEKLKKLTKKEKKTKNNSKKRKRNE